MLHPHNVWRTTPRTFFFQETQQSWLWAAPAKHSPRQIEEPPERIETLPEPGASVHERPDRLPINLELKMSGQGPIKRLRFETENVIAGAVISGGIFDVRKEIQ
jgi:hypothetical protein